MSHSAPTRTHGGVDQDRRVTQRKRDEVEVRLLPNADNGKSLKERLREAARKPIEAVIAARAKVGRSRKEHDAALLTEAVIGFGAAGGLKAAPEQWRPFAENPLWADFEGHKPNPKKPQNHLGWVMKAVFEARDKRGKDRANVYRGGLQAKFDEGADPATLIEWVKSEGGIDAAHRKTLASKQAKADESAEPKASDDSRSADNEEDEQEVVEKGGSAEGEGEDERESEDGIFSRIMGRLNRMRGRSTKPILIKAPSILFDKVVDQYVDADEVNIRCTLTRKPDGWVDMTVTKVWRRSSKP